MIEQAAIAIGRALAGRRWRGRTELDIANEIERVLGLATFTDPPIRFVREHPLTAADRLDFAAVLPGELANIIVIEVKIERATVTDTARQAQRYLAHQQVGALILASTSRRLATQMPRELQGKPVYSIVLPRM